MSLPLSDVFRILHTVKSYMEKGPASRRYVKDTFNDAPVRQARIPDYGEIEAAVLQTGPAVSGTRHDQSHTTW